MKRKLIVAFLVMSLSVISIGAYAINREMTRKQSVENFLDVVNKDLVNSYEVLQDTENYIIMDNDTINKLLSGDLEGFNDNKKNTSIVKEIANIQAGAPMKSTYPIIMLKKDGEEIIVAYKSKEGINTLISAKSASKVVTPEELLSTRQVSEKWVQDIKEEQGEVINAQDYINK